MLSPYKCHKGFSVWAGIRGVSIMTFGIMRSASARGLVVRPKGIAGILQIELAPPVYKESVGRILLQKSQIQPRLDER